MIFNETTLEGAYEILPEPRVDERGYFARTFCKNEFTARGLETNMVQANTSFSAACFTLRGMHFQKGSSAETKLIRCIKGKILDVIIDIRPASGTYLKHFSIELSQENNKQLYVPAGFAHGYITLAENSEITYLVSNFYDPRAEGGIRWNDPLFSIQWPTNSPIISPKDAAHPNFVR